MSGIDEVREALRHAALLLTGDIVQRDEASTALSLIGGPEAFTLVAHAAATEKHPMLRRDLEDLIQFWRNDTPADAVGLAPQEKP